MTENQNPEPVQPSRRFDLSRLIAVLMRPRQVFTSIASEEKPSWLTPLLVASLTVLLMIVMGGYLKTRAALTAEVALPPDWQYWSTDMQDNFMQGQQVAQSPARLYVLPSVGALIGLWLGWLILSGMLHLGSTLLGGRGSMGSALSVVAWASVPFILRDLLRVVFMLIAGHAIQNAGLSGFASGAGMAFQLLARTDLFVVWNVILLILGLKIVDSLPTGKAIGGIVVIVLLSLLVQAGVASMFANLGSSLQGGFF
jgi:hypothetical protein